jgi:hypothetical protein
MNISARSASINAKIAEKEINIQLVSAPDNFVINGSEYNPVLWLRKNVKAVVVEDANSLNFEITKDVSYNVSFSIKIENSKIEKIDDKNLKIDDDILLSIDFGKFDFNVKNTILIKVFNDLTNLKLSSQSSFNQLNTQEVTAFTSPSGLPTIPFGVREPEFSIGIFDYYNSSKSVTSSADPAFKLPRLIRHGVPVISTVPAEDNAVLTESEKNAYATGLGESSKKLYFKIVCNSILESALTTGSTSKCQLKIYLPNGLDTVKAAEYVSMTLLHKDTAKNISIYYADYTFHKSGIQDNVEYVDGYMYFDVYSPVTVQRDIPLQFDFLIS